MADNNQAVSHLFVVLDATGDLMRRKLLPALFHLGTQGRMKERCLILGAARREDLSDTGFRVEAREALAAAGFQDNELVGRWCDECLFYQTIGAGEAADYRALAARIVRLERQHHLPGNRVFYLALPPNALPSTVAGLGEAGLNRAPGWSRLVVEKPFGRDLASARDLNLLVITLQPEEGFDLRFEVKAPGQPLSLQTQRLHFRYTEAFGRLPDAYETLLLDIITGNQTLFVHAEEVEAAWRLYTPLLTQGIPVHPYPAGSWGPEAASRLLGPMGGAREVD